MATPTIIAEIAPGGVESTPGSIESAPGSLSAGRYRTGAAFAALLILTQVPGVFTFTVPIPLLARIAQTFAHVQGSAYLAKMVLGVLGPTMAIGSATGGWLADKYDRRWLVMAISAIYVLAGIAPILLDDLGWIVVTRAFAGWAAGALMTIGMTMVGDYLPEEKRAGTIGLLSAANMIASVVTLPIAGTIGDAGWRLPFLLYLLAAPAIVLASLKPLPVPGKRAAVHGEPGVHSAGARHWTAGLPWGLVLLALANGVILTIPGIYVSFHLATIGLGKASTVGFIMTLNAIVAIASSVMFGRIWHRSKRRLFCLGFGSMAIGLAVLAFASGYAAVIPAMILMGAAMGFLVPTATSWAAETVAEGQRGKIMGLIQGTTSIAPLLCISLLEPVMPLIGTRGMMLAVGTLSAVLLLFFAVVRLPKRASACA